MAWESTAPDGTKSVKANETILQSNTTYTETEMNIDHYWNVGANEDGHHKQVQMVKKAAEPALDAGMDSFLYAFDNSETEMYLKNATSVMQLLGIKACVVFNYAAGAAQTIVYSYNVASVTKTSTGKYTITYTNALPTNKYLVLGNAIRNNADTGKAVLVSMQGSVAVNTVKSTALCKINTNSQSGSVIDPLQTWVVCFGG